MLKLKAGTVQTSMQRRAEAVLAGGVSSNTRLLNPALIVERARGSRLWDVDGKEYIDYVLGQGPNFLGYAHPRVLEKVLAAQRGGAIFAATHRHEIEAAEAVLSVLTWAETLRFGSSSSEMVQAALRMARYATGREKVLRFHGHYHGWFDNIAVKTIDGEAVAASGGQLHSALDEVLTAPWNDLNAFKAVMADHHTELAAVIMEPMMLNVGSIPPAEGYLEGVRQICTERGIVLIFDETITGFRIAVGGATGRFGVIPDLAVYGKAMAAGWPCAALVGRRELFDGVASGVVVHAGTFNGSTVATAAVLACLHEIADGQVHRHVERVGTELMGSLAAMFDRHQLGVVVQGLPMAFHARFAVERTVATRYEQVLESDTERYGRLVEMLAEAGIWVSSRGIWYVSAAHDDVDVSATLASVETVLGSFHPLETSLR